MEDVKPDVVKIAITGADDLVMIMHFVTDDHHGLTQEPTTENIQACIDKASISYPAEKVPVKSWRIIEDHSEIPTDRTYRNAWKDNGAMIYTCMDTARVLHKNILRAERAPLLASLDVEYQRADEEGDDTKKQEIVARKNVLRNITKHPDIETAQTVEDLKEAGVDILQSE